MMKVTNGDKTSVWQNGSAFNRLYQLSMLLFIAVLSFLSVWLFERVASFPETYPTKLEVQGHMDKLEVTMVTRLASMENKIDDINQYLRDAHKPPVK